MDVSELPQVRTLNEYLQVSRERYDACIDVVGNDLSIDGIDATLRMHFVKFDSNGQPKFVDLAKCLADHIMTYCYSAKRLDETLSPDQLSRLYREARDLFTKRSTSGEAGDVLLYFLVEAVLEAPQVVAKIALKTNPNMEVHGSDGIHMKWDEDDGVLDVYFGEAKLYQDLSDAAKSAVESISNFHKQDILSRELEIVTSNFKLANDNLKEAITAYLDRQDPSQPDCRIKHACLIGYDWDEYAKLDDVDRQRLVDEFQRRYTADAPRLRRVLGKHFEGFAHRRLIFEVFFLPFGSVQEFRDAFNAALTGK